MRGPKRDPAAQAAPGAAVGEPAQESGNVDGVKIEAGQNVHVLQAEQGDRTAVLQASYEERPSQHLDRPVRPAVETVEARADVQR